MSPGHVPHAHYLGGYPLGQAESALTPKGSLRPQSPSPPPSPSPSPSPSPARAVHHWNMFRAWRDEEERHNEQQAGYGRLSSPPPQQQQHIKVKSKWLGGSSSSSSHSIVEQQQQRRPVRVQPMPADFTQSSGGGPPGVMGGPRGEMPPASNGGFWIQGSPGGAWLSWRGVLDNLASDKVVGRAGAGAGAEREYRTNKVAQVQVGGSYPAGSSRTKVRPWPTTGT